jgi:AmmeMemoRadiSam system protein B/AmmeMemoRadiSam system protein A
MWFLLKRNLILSPQNLKFAGSFFPKDPEAMHQLMDGFDAELHQELTAKDSSPIAIIAPHAGYQFSGQLAATAYASCRGQMPKQIVILSPSHRCAFDGIAVAGYQAYEVAGRVLTVNEHLRADLVKRGFVQQNNTAHNEEHGIETQLPFISRHFDGAQVLPLVIGKTTPQAVSAVIDHIVSILQEKLLFVLSSDLSHFHSHETAQKLDGEAASLIETGQRDKLGPKQACGYMAIVGFLASGVGRNARASRLAMADSFAVTQDANRVVGYGAWAFFPPDCEILPQEQRETILRVARQGTGMFLKAGRHPKIMLNSFAMPLRGYIPSFITFTHNDRLRGCIGSLAPCAPLISDVVTNGIKAATGDTRFTPLKTGEQLAQLRLKVAVLSHTIELAFTDQDDLLSQMIPRVSGLILQFRTRRSTFLPMVWDSLPDRQNFLNGLKLKAGLPTDFWSEEIKIMQFQAESFSDSHKI